MIRHNLDELVATSERILLLQGPIGSFFYEFAQWLGAQGKTVYKINFNAGDEYTYPLSIANTFAYRDSLADFPEFLTAFCREHAIDALVCFGDTRHYHRQAKEVAHNLDLSFWVFEEGYFRPHYVTLEKDGVNAFSTLPRHADFFAAQQPQLHEAAEPKPLAKGFSPMAKRAIRYYLHAYFKRDRYPNYRHHRLLNVCYYLKLWVISALKRAYYAIYDRDFAKRVEKGEFGEFFIMPLQVYDDSQVRIHSEYGSVATFLKRVLESFALHAPAQTRLIVKQHPMDRGFIDYSKIIDECCKQYPNLVGRIFYIHDVPMPVFLRYGKGMITLNSTSGISALLHGMPVITLGKASYHMAGLTHQGELSDFWHNPTAPDPDLFNAYRLFHLNKTQINGSFYNHVDLRYPYHS